MRRSMEQETKRETQIMCWMTFVCYVLALSATVLLTYSLMTLTLSAVGQKIVYVIYGQP